MLRLITGADDTLKTEYAIRDLAERALAAPQRRFIFIVPEQFTLETQKNVLKLHPRHACMNIDIVSFNRLATVVLSKLGISTASVLDETGKALILRNVLEKCRDDLDIYKSKIRTEGFLAEVKSTIAEFRQYGIDDNALFLMQERAQDAGEKTLYKKLCDIRLIFRKTEEEIQDRYTTPEDILNLFERKISESEFLKGSEIYLDGFTGFTPVQYRIIKELLSHAHSVTCALTVPKGKIDPACHETDVFYLSCSTYFRLIRISEDSKAPGEVQSIFVPETQKEPISVESLRFADTAGEVIFAASKVIELIRNKNLRFRDIAVLTPDIEEYHSKIKKIFDEAGIPVFIDHKTTIPGNTLVRFLLAAIDIKTDNMSHDSVFALLKTGYSRISPDDIAYLENYCLEYGIRGVNAWKKPFEANRIIYSSKEEYWDLGRLNSLRTQIYEMLLTFIRSCKRTDDEAGSYAAALKQLMKDVKAQDICLELAEELKANGEAALAEQYGQICGQLEELLDKITLLMGKEVLSIREFREILFSGVSEIKTGVIPPALDVVTAGDLNRTRLGEIRVLFVIGCNDGRLPQAGAQAGLLSQAEREFLKSDFELAPTVFENLYMQQFYLYLCFNKPKEALYLTWAGKSGSGDEMYPSNVLEELPELIAGYEPVQESTETDLPLWQAQAERQFAAAISEYVKNAKEEESGPVPGTEKLKKLASLCGNQSEVLLNAAFFSNRQTPLTNENAGELYGEVLKGSISRFEKYYECPYMHFLTYGMGLEERKVYEIKAADMGTIYHDALERYSKYLQEKGISFRLVSDEQSHEISDICVEEAINAQPGDLLSSTARNTFFQERVKQITRKTTDALRMQVCAGKFEPEGFEHQFTEKIADGTIRFSGKIDRIDIYEHEESGNVFVKIIDYKSGSRDFSVKDIYSGLQLQLAAYMDEAIKEAKHQYPDSEVKPAGIYYYLINDKFVKNDDEEKKKYQMKGLTLSEYEIPEAMDKNLSGAGSASNIIQVAYDKKNADFTSSSLVAGEKEFQNLIDFTKKSIENAGEGILHGDVSLRPWHENDSKCACRYCEHRDICKFEAGNFGTDWKKETDLSTEEIKKALYGRG